jgi:cysteine-rich repeat protein
VDDVQDAAEARDDGGDVAFEAEARRDRGGEADAPPDGPALPPACGDGRVDPGEECDDGNRLNGDECDWECRTGPGDFDYPDPDPSVPPLAPAGPAVESVPAGESVCGVGADARSLALLWGSRSYALAYVVDSPQYGFRVRTLDEGGTPHSAAWSRDEPWGAPRVLLGWIGTAFGVFWSTGQRSPVRQVVLNEDGAELSPPGDVVPPTPEFPWVVLQDVAWSADRYAMLVALCAADWGEGGVGFAGCVPRIQAVDESGSALPRSILLDPYANSEEVPARLVGLDRGFAFTDGSRVIVLSPDLAITGWSGGLTCTGDCRGAALAGAVSAGDGLLLLWTEDARSGEIDYLDLWAVPLDGAGAIVAPPRTVVESFAPLHSRNGGFYVASGPAGAAVAYSAIGLAPRSTDAEVRIVNTDRWGNPRSNNVVFSTAVDAYDYRSPFAIAADGAGYAIVAVVGLFAGGERIMFRRYVPAP